MTLEAWRRLPEPRPELCLFGIEPQLAREPGIRYVTAPSDEQVGELFNEASVFVQTSIHEGFCLPPLESMATGGAVVCTDAHGNRDFCRRRRELPDAAAGGRAGRRARSSACSATAAARTHSVRAAFEPPPSTPGSGGSTHSRPS